MVVMNARTRNNNKHVQKDYEDIYIMYSCRNPVHSNRYEHVVRMIQH
jgi:hypothetical protein